jgi:hypothetical protein
MKKVFLVINIFLLSALSTQAQIQDDPVIDSLIAVVTTNSDPCQNVRTIFSAGEYYKSIDPDRAYNFFMKAAVMAKDCRLKHLEVESIIHISSIALHNDLENAQNLFLKTQVLVDKYNLKEDFDEGLLELFVAIKLKLGEPEQALDLLLENHINDIGVEFQVNYLQMLAKSCLAAGRTDSAEMFLNKIHNLPSLRLSDKAQNLLIARDICFNRKDYIESDSLNEALLSLIEENMDVYSYNEALIKRASYPADIRSNDTSLAILFTIIENETLMQAFPDLNLMVIDQIEKIYLKNEDYHEAYLLLNEKKKIGFLEVSDKIGEAYSYGTANQYVWVYIVIVALLLLLSSLIVIHFRTKSTKRLIS